MEQGGNFCVFIEIEADEENVKAFGDKEIDFLKASVQFKSLITIQIVTIGKDEGETRNHATQHKLLQKVQEVPAICETPFIR